MGVAGALGQEESKKKEDKELFREEGCGVQEGGKKKACCMAQGRVLRKLRHSRRNFVGKGKRGPRTLRNPEGKNRQNPIERGDLRQGSAGGWV